MSQHGAASEGNGSWDQAAAALALAECKALPASFYARPVEAVARELVGHWLFRRTRSGLMVAEIVETEAYLASGDSACHAARGKTPRNAAMFGPAGWSYVYAIHSRWCFNVVCEPRGVPAAVLIRAAVPLFGIAGMRRRRGSCSDRDLLRGPARLCEALEIDKRLNAWPLHRNQRLWIARSVPRRRISIATSPRIGVTSAHHLPLRFFVDGCRYVSGPRKWHSQSSGAQ